MAKIQLNLAQNHIAATTTGHTLPPEIYGISDNNLMIKF